MNCEIGVEVSQAADHASSFTRVVSMLSPRVLASASNGGPGHAATGFMGTGFLSGRWSRQAHS